MSLALAGAATVAKAGTDVPRLPLNADYCTILRAFTDGPDRNCPTLPRPTATRSVSHAAVPPGDALDERGYFIRFAFDSAQLTPAFQRHLTQVSQVLRSDAMSELCLLLVGHTDSLGSATYNESLSARRARAVKLYLEGVAGVSPTRLGTSGMGESEPLSGLAPDDPRNRRVEILAKPRDGATCG
ncbi:OmpA family protein [Pseudaestuariivita atlantica]|uniref:OmpA family protein n=1 Tax=Pseudaestuariivita atlantica TaxID=1317121 RepID=UPI0013F3E646|nr:OmpA family protein [Pseudaestuariivita atlantica]